MLPKRAPSLGIQRPKLQSQSIGEFIACMVTPPCSGCMMESLILERWGSVQNDEHSDWVRPFRYSTEATEPELSMKLTPATESDSLEDA